MNKLEILIQGRLDDLTHAHNCQTWKHLAFADISKERDDNCWQNAMTQADIGHNIREFSRKLVGEKFVNKSDTKDKVLFDPRVKLALVLWSEEHSRAMETKEKWLEFADLRSREVA